MTESGLEIRRMLDEDIGEVSEIEHVAWHEYYSQYPIYETIKGSVSVPLLIEDWIKFISAGESKGTTLVIGEERAAFVALLNGQIIAVAAVSSYVEGKWLQVDEMLRGSDGKVAKTAKFQELYVRPNTRGVGVGHHLSVVRADYMLRRGYTALFLTTYADANKTNEYHLKNGLKQVHEYMSFQVYENGQRARIACFLDADLKGYRDRMQQALQSKIKSGSALALCGQVRI